MESCGSKSVGIALNLNYAKEHSIITCIKGLTKPQATCTYTNYCIFFSMSISWTIGKIKISEIYCLIVTFLVLGVGDQKIEREGGINLWIVSIDNW